MTFIKYTCYLLNTIQIDELESLFVEDGLI